MLTISVSDIENKDKYIQHFEPLAPGCLFNHSLMILNCLLTAPKQQLELTTTWTKQFPKKAGVYLLWEDEKIIYVGETASIRSRMNNLLRTVNHQVRRNIANKHFSTVAGFEKGSSRKKHPEHIEELLNDFLENNVKLSFYPITIGRKEIEEAICKVEEPIFNKR